MAGLHMESHDSEDKEKLANHHHEGAQIFLAYILSPIVFVALTESDTHLLKTQCIL